MLRLWNNHVKATRGRTKVVSGAIARMTGRNNKKWLDTWRAEAKKNKEQRGVQKMRGEFEGEINSLKEEVTALKGEVSERDYEIEELRCQGIKPWDPEARAAVEMLFPGRRPYDPKKPDPIDDSDDDYDDDYEPGLFDKLVSSHPDRRCRALLASVAHDSQVDDLNREVLANMSKMNDPALLAHMIQTFKQGLPD